MTHTEAAHNLVFSFNDLLDAMPTDAQPADAAALATLFSNACVNGDEAEGAQAFTQLSHQLMASQARRDQKAQPAPQPVEPKAVRQQQQGETCAIVPAAPAAPANQLVDTILKAMNPQIQAEAERRIQQRLAARQQQ